ncbi:MAG: hypothetical protein U5K37_05085 [Natrialbaceae archaeon]|nr:hypothetical protein [Natrialbaceae archaeon]
MMVGPPRILAGYILVLGIGFGAVGGPLGGVVGILTGISLALVGVPAAVGVGVFGSVVVGSLASDPLGWAIRGGLLFGLVALSVYDAREDIPTLVVTLGTGAVLVGLTGGALELWGPLVASAVPLVTGAVVLYGLHRVELVTFGLVSNGGDPADG